MKKYLVFFSLCMGLSSCKEKEKFQNWYNTTQALKSEVEQKVSFDVTNTNDFMLLKKYFSQMKDLSVELALKKNIQDKIATFLSTQNKGVFCEDLFLADETLELINSACTKNGFYLCSPEVENYFEFIQVIYDSLDDKSKATWTNNNSCPAVKN